MGDRDLGVISGMMGCRGMGWMAYIRRLCRELSTRHWAGQHSEVRKQRSWQRTVVTGKLGHRAARVKSVPVCTAVQNKGQASLLFGNGRLYSRVVSIVFGTTCT